MKKDYKEEYREIYKDSIWDFIFDRNKSDFITGRMRWMTIKAYAKELYDYLMNYFDDGSITEDTVVKEAVYRVGHNICYDDIPLCSMCGEHKVKFNNLREGYKRCCSICLDKKEAEKKKRIAENKIIRQAEKERIENIVYDKDNILDEFMDDGKHFNPMKSKWEYLKKNNPKLLDFMLNYYDTPIDIETETVSSVVYRIHNGISEIPTCKRIGCNNKIQFSQWRDGFRECCSPKCHHNMRKDNYAALIKENRFFTDDDLKRRVEENVQKGREENNIIVTNKDELMEFMFAKGDGDTINESRCHWYFLYGYPYVYKFVLDYFDKENQVDVTKYSCISVLYRIYHDIKENPKCECPGCNNDVQFYHWGVGFHTYCSDECNKSVEAQKLQLEKRENRYREMYGDDIRNPQQVPEIKEKMLQTVENRYGDRCMFRTQHYKDKTYETNMERYGVPNSMQSEEVQAKCRKTHMERYGVEYTFFIPYVIERTFSEEAKEKIRQTKRKNGTFNTSIIQKNFSEYIKTTYGDDVVEEYSSDNRYPYACDFYIKSMDLFIEIQGAPGHGDHPYDEDSDEDNSIVEKWESKDFEKTPLYKSMIDVWTQSDVAKRYRAKEKGLNYIEIFSVRSSEAIEALNDYINNKKQGYALYIYNKHVNSN